MFCDDFQYLEQFIFIYSIYRTLFNQWFFVLASKLFLGEVYYHKWVDLLFWSELYWHRVITRQKSLDVENSILVLLNFYVSLKGNKMHLKS